MVRNKKANHCMQRTRRLRFVYMLNIYWRRVADARRSGYIGDAIKLDYENTVYTYRVNDLLHFDRLRS